MTRIMSNRFWDSGALESISNGTNGKPNINNQRVPIRRRIGEWVEMENGKWSWKMELENGVKKWKWKWEWEWESFNTVIY